MDSNSNTALFPEPRSHDLRLPTLDGSDHPKRCDHGDVGVRGLPGEVARLDEPIRLIRHDHLDRIRFGWRKRHDRPREAPRRSRNLHLHAVRQPATRGHFYQPRSLSDTHGPPGGVDRRYVGPERPPVDGFWRCRRPVILEENRQELLILGRHEKHGGGIDLHDRRLPCSHRSTEGEPTFHCHGDSLVLVPYRHRDGRLPRREPHDQRRAGLVRVFEHLGDARISHYPSERGRQNVAVAILGDREDLESVMDADGDLSRLHVQPGYLLRPQRPSRYNAGDRRRQPRDPKQSTS